MTNKREGNPMSAAHPSTDFIEPFWRTSFVCHERALPAKGRHILTIRNKVQ